MWYDTGKNILVNCETHNLSLLYMQIKQLLRRYYEAVGTWMLYFSILVPLLAECSESVPSCNVSFAYAFTKI